MDRFWSKVNKHGPVHPKLKTRCWLWTASVDTSGYGLVKIAKKLYKAHRLSWFLKYGKWPIPCALHKCDNTRCVRPSHLFEGDRLTNNKDRDSKGRGVSVKGVNHGLHVLDDSKILKIRKLYRKKGASCRKLAKILGVHATTISRVVTHKTWKHLEA